MNIKSLSIVRKLVIIVLVLVALNTIVLFSVRIYSTGSASISCSGNLFCLDFIVFAIIGFTYNELVFILLFYAIRRKSRALGVIGLVLLASILRYPVQDYIGSKLNIINSQNEYAAQLKKIDFAIYIPKYLPSSLVFSDWDNSNGIYLILTYKFGNVVKNINHPLQILTYKDNGNFEKEFNSADCNSLSVIEIPAPVNYNCKLFVRTPSGREVFRAAYTDPLYRDPVFFNEPVMFKLGPTVIMISENSYLQQDEKLGSGSMSMKDFEKLIDSFTEVNPEKLLEMRSVKDKIREKIF